MKKLASLLACLATSVAALLPVVASAGTIVYYHNDLLGSPVVASNAAGQVIWKESYRPYGERITNAAASSTNDIWFTGRRQDVESGLVYMGARYYDPAIGRFLSEDAVGFDAQNVHSFNRYAYARNNPYKFLDPDGNRDVMVSVWLRNPHDLLKLEVTVGHVMISETDGSTILSQFPIPHGSHGANTTKDWKETRATEGAPPDAIYRVFVPNDEKFDEAARSYKGRKNWDWDPTSINDTNCVHAAYNALEAGGITVPKSAIRLPYLNPDGFNEGMQTLAEKPKNRVWQMPAPEWQKQSP